jgi:hypothetical protein
MPADFESAERTTQLDLRDPWLNTTIDRRYRLTSVLGEGGMGMVYEAVQLSMDRPVAIKMLRSDDETNRRRLLREVRLLTQLEHPNIVHVLDGGETESGAVFLVMERLVGRTRARCAARDLGATARDDARAGGFAVAMGDARRRVARPHARCIRADAAVCVAVANRTLRNAGGVTRTADLGRERSR